MPTSKTKSLVKPMHSDSKVKIVVYTITKPYVSCRWDYLSQPKRLVKVMSNLSKKLPKTCSRSKIKLRLHNRNKNKYWIIMVVYKSKTLGKGHIVVTCQKYLNNFLIKN